MAKKKNTTRVENQNTEAPALEGQTAEADPKTESPKAEAKQICLVPGCGREAKVRSLCSRCSTTCACPNQKRA